MQNSFIACDAMLQDIYPKKLHFIRKLQITGFGSLPIRQHYINNRLNQRFEKTVTKLT